MNTLVNQIVPQTIVPSGLKSDITLRRSAKTITEARNSQDLMGLDFQVNKRKAGVYMNGRFIEAEGFHLIEAQGYCYASAKDGYGLIQPREWFNAVLDVLEASNLPIIEIEVSRIRGRMFIDVTLIRHEVARADRRIGDIVAFKVRLGDSFDLSLNLSTLVAALRLWCLNGCTHTLDMVNERRRHTKNIEVNDALKMIKARSEDLGTFIQAYDLLGTTEVSPSEREHLVNLIVGYNPEKEYKKANRLNTRDKVLELSIRGKGNYGRTMFDVFNGVTEYVNHHRVARGAKTDTEVAASRFLEAGKIGSLATRSWSVLEKALQVDPFTIQLDDKDEVIDV